MEQDLIMALEEGKVVSAVHAASLRTKLLQIASGAVYNTDGEGAYSIVDTTRYELIGELVEGREHSVVFFNWKHQRDLLCKEFEARHLSFALIDGSVQQRERDRIVKDYQDGKYRTILLHPRTGAHGLTLTRGDTTIFASPLYEADLLAQGIKRIHRGVQDKVTNTILVEAKGTVEAKVYARLDDKTARMEDLLDLMKRRA
jgi:SNF2 family DNA or RNA helicase